MDAGNMLAIWLDHRPECSKEQRDPDGWISGVSGTKYEAERLCELAGVPDAELVVLHGAAAEWWSRIHRARKAAASKERRKAQEGRQQLIPIPAEVEQLGREAAALRSERR